MILGYFVAPLGCWLLAARTPRRRWWFAALFAAWGFLEVGVWAHWFLGALRDTVLIPSAVLVPALLFRAVVVERRGLGWPRRSGVRDGLATAALTVYGVVVAAVVLVGGLLVAGNGLPHEMPSAEDVLPLPPGLTVVDVSQGCGNGSTATCSTDVRIRTDGSETGLQAADRLRAQLAGTQGWPLTGSAPSWEGCRDEGWLLDRHEVCLFVESAAPAPADELTASLQIVSGW